MWGRTSHKNNEHDVKPEPQRKADWKGLLGSQGRKTTAKKGEPLDHNDENDAEKFPGPESVHTGVFSK